MSPRDSITSDRQFEWQEKAPRNIAFSSFISLFLLCFKQGKLESAPSYKKKKKKSFSAFSKNTQSITLLCPEPSLFKAHLFRWMLLWGLTLVSGRTGPLQLPHSINQNNAASKLTWLTNGRTLCSKIIGSIAAGCCADGRPTKMEKSQMCSLPRDADSSFRHH